MKLPHTDFREAGRTESSPHLSPAIGAAWQSEERPRPDHSTSLSTRTSALSDEELDAAAAVQHQFPMLAGPVADLIDWSDPADPVRVQFVPRPQETRVRSGESDDPIGDLTHNPVTRVTHRYPDRVLLHVTERCPVHCRYCFRRKLRRNGTKRADQNPEFDTDSFGPAFSYIESHRAVREVILTGGDPLMLADDDLAWLRRSVDAIPHIRLLRVHTRMPTLCPARVNQGLVDALRGRTLTAIVLHVNHPQEITESAVDATRILRESGFLIFNQSVLLRGVNDDPHTLAELGRELVYSLGAKPYYLHHCDMAEGTAHFRTRIEDGQRLIGALRGNISGLCIPTYVLDLPGGRGKAPLELPPIIEAAPPNWKFRGFQGGVWRYAEVTEESGPTTGGEEVVS